MGSVRQRYRLRGPVACGGRHPWGLEHDRAFRPGSRPRRRRAPTCRPARQRCRRRGSWRLVSTRRVLEYRAQGQRTLAHRGAGPVATRSTFACPGTERSRRGDSCSTVRSVVVDLGSCRPPAPFVTVGLVPHRQVVLSRVRERNTSTVAAASSRAGDRAVRQFPYVVGIAVSISSAFDVDAHRARCMAIMVADLRTRRGGRAGGEVEL
jgi:hypothetical protein